MSRPSVNVLLTSVGRRVELVNAFKQAYRELNIDGHLIGTDINALAPGLHVVDRPYITPRINSEQYIDTLVSICQKELVHLVFPLVDPDITRLSEARELMETTGTRLVVISPQAAATVNDKWLTYQFFEHIGIPTPRSWLPHDIPKDHDFPLFLKPRHGSASQSTYKIRNERELNFFSDYVEYPIVQEYLSGPEITNDVLCDLTGNVLSVVSRKRLEVRGGEVVKGTTLYDQNITNFCIAIANNLPAVGPITIQCILKEEQPFFTEINARFGGGIPLSIAAGANFPKIILAQQANINLDIPRIGEYKTDLFVSRFDSGFYIDAESRDEMASRRI